MKIRTTAALLLITAIATAAWAQDKGKAPAAAAPKAAASAHKMFTAKDLEWKDTPSLPGAKIAVLEGPMNEAVPFTARIKLPNNYKIAPHTHPGIEHVTVISGSFGMGLGEKFDEKGLHTLGPGDMMIMQPGTAHYAKSKGETVVQIHGVGPWKVVYVNPDDDPTKKPAAPAAKKDEKKK